MRKLFNIMMMATALTLGWGCSSSNDDNADAAGDKGTSVAEAPQWKVEFKMPQGTAGKPDWASRHADFYQFQNTMTAVVRMEDEMLPFLSMEDQMAAIVGDEVRELDFIQHYAYEDNEQFYQFMLLIPFAEQDKTADLYYYNAKADQSYRLTTIDLKVDATLGSETTFVVGLFSMGSIMAKLDASVPFAYAAGDQLALFVGEECIGTGTYDAAQQQWAIKVYKPATVDTEAHFRYYSTQKQAIYKTGKLIDLTTLPRSVLTPYYLSF